MSEFSLESLRSQLRELADEQEKKLAVILSDKERMGPVATALRLHTLVMSTLKRLKAFAGAQEVRSK